MTKNKLTWAEFLIGLSTLLLMLWKGWWEKV